MRLTSFNEAHILATAQAFFEYRSWQGHDGPLYKIYAESFRGPEHLAQVQSEAREVVSAALSDLTTACVGHGQDLIGDLPLAGLAKPALRSSARRVYGRR